MTTNTLKSAQDFLESLGIPKDATWGICDIDKMLVTFANQFTIEVLKKVGNKFDHPTDAKAITEIIRHKDFINDKIQELKQYLNEN